MSIVLLHHNESIFPKSHTFLPERWLSQSQGMRLDKYMVSFGKGSRQCLGMEYVYLSYFFLFWACFLELCVDLIFFFSFFTFFNYQLSILLSTLSNVPISSFPAPSLRRLLLLSSILMPTRDI